VVESVFSGPGAPGSFACSSAKQGKACDTFQLQVWPIGRTMRTIIFGGGDAQADIPDNWVAQVQPNGALVVSPPEQDDAFLWLSTLSWDTPDRPDFSPAGDYLTREDSPSARLEVRPDVIIAYTVEDAVEDGMRLDSHQYQVLPKRAVHGHSIVAFLTLSVKHESADSQVIRQMVEAVWSVARSTVFKNETEA
jgi:hypothetical protein